MRQQKRKIMLFMDNVSSHVGSDAIDLSNVTVKFLPLSTTSHLQPLDGGIIQAFKLRYRQKLMEYILAHVDTCMSGTALAKQITVLNAVKWCGKAWDEVSEDTIQKCFRNCGFKWDGAQESDVRDEMNETESCSELLAAVEASGVTVDATVGEFVAIDENIATESMDDCEEDLVRSYIERMKDSDDDDDYDGTDDNVISIPELVLTIR